MTVHHLELAIAIQNERDPRRRMQLLRELSETARDPVLAWLWADALRAGRDARCEMGDVLRRAEAVHG